MGRTRNFHRFLLLWAGELASSIGSGLTSFGLGVYVFRQTGRAADMALVSLLAFLPTLLLSVPAGGFRKESSASADSGSFGHNLLHGGVSDSG